MARGKYRSDLILNHIVPIIDEGRMEELTSRSQATQHTITVFVGVWWVVVMPQYVAICNATDGNGRRCVWVGTAVEAILPEGGGWCRWLQGPEDKEGKVTS